jgi:hypothetical protein
LIKRRADRWTGRWAGNKTGKLAGKQVRRKAGNKTRRQDRLKASEREHRLTIGLAGRQAGRLTGQRWMLSFSSVPPRFIIFDVIFDVIKLREVMA